MRRQPKRRYLMLCTTVCFEYPVRHFTLLNAAVIVMLSRVCPGKLADAKLWIVIADNLVVYDIRPLVDPISGRRELSKKEFTSCITM